MRVVRAEISTAMIRLMFALTLGVWIGVAPAETGRQTQTRAMTPPQSRVPDSKQLEKELQQLSWKQFRTVIEAIPRLRADVEAYGPAGWQYVKAKYQSHAWKKNIDRLDDNEKRQLARLILDARKSR